MEHLAQDLRYGLRAMRQGTSWAAVLMLAVAIGLSTAMFAVLDALILRPVPFPNADRLVQINLRGQNNSRPPFWEIVYAWKRDGPFERVENQVPDTALVGADVGSVAVTSARVSPGMLEMLGAKPIRGRTFSAPDEGGVVISETLWRKGFNGDPRIIGRSVAVDRDAEVVIGVMPASFRFPERNTEAWRLFTPYMLREIQPITYALLSDRVPLDQALSLATNLAHEADKDTAGRIAVAIPFAGVSNNTYAERALPVLGGGAVLVFLALCANASALLLARFTARRRQFGLRAALGASRSRLLGQASIESAVIGATGAIAGIGLAGLIVNVAEKLLPRAFLARSLRALEIDTTAVAIAAGLAVLATLFAGLAPAWVATRVNVSSALRVAESTGTEARSARLMSRGLIVTEIALACALLVGGALLVRSFVNLASIDRGFDSRGLTVVQMEFDAMVGETRDPVGRRAAIARATDAFRAMPGVSGVAWSIGAPTTPVTFTYGGQWRADTPGVAAIELAVRGMSVGGDFLELYGVPVLRGRVLAPADAEIRGPVVIDERMAAALWPGIDPVGRSFTWSNPRTAAAVRFEVVGVAKSVRRLVIDRSQDYPTMYFPFSLGSSGHGSTVSLRCIGTCPTEGVIRKQLISVAPEFQVSDVKRVDDVYNEDLAEPRLTAGVAIAFSSVALLAAAGGLFSVLNYAVGRRRREFGIRTALGASRRAIGALVIRDGAVVAVAGLGLGSIAAWFLARALESVQYGVTISDPAVWLSVIGILAVTIALASWHPAHAAMRVDPVSLLKED